MDPDGRFIGFISDVVSVGIGVRSFAKNISAGNIRGAVWDGVGVVVDVVAAAIPVVPEPIKQSKTVSFLFELHNINSSISSTGF